MQSLKNWFKKTFPDEPTPRAERRNVPGLEAFHWTGSSPGLDNIKDISSTGIYLQTNERWPTGEINPIRLTCEDLPVTTSSCRRNPFDGAKMAWALPSSCRKAWNSGCGGRINTSIRQTSSMSSESLEPWRFSAVFAPQLRRN